MNYIALLLVLLLAPGVALAQTDPEAKLRKFATALDQEGKLKYLAFGRCDVPERTGLNAPEEGAMYLNDDCVLASAQNGSSEIPIVGGDSGGGSNTKLDRPPGSSATRQICVLSADGARCERIGILCDTSGNCFFPGDVTFAGRVYTGGAGAVQVRGYDAVKNDPANCANLNADESVNKFTWLPGSDGTMKLCLGQTEVNTVFPTSAVAQPYGTPSAGGDAPSPADGQCRCMEFQLQNSLVGGADRVTVQTDTAVDNDDTVEIGIYSQDGQTQYFEGVIPAGTGGATVVSMTNTITAARMSAGKYLLCQSFDNGADADPTYDLRSNTNASNWNRARFADVTCTGGEMPATVSPSLAWGGTELPAFQISDE